MGNVKMGIMRMRTLCVSMNSRNELVYLVKYSVNNKPTTITVSC